MFLFEKEDIKKLRNNFYPIFYVQIDSIIVVLGMLVGKLLFFNSLGLGQLSTFQ